VSRGHIRRRGRNSWEIKIELGTDTRTGKRQTRYHSCKGSRKDAQAELTRLLSTMDKGGYVEPSRLSVTDFLARWDRDWASMNVSPKTLERYRQLIMLNIVPHIGALSVQRLRPVDLNELYAKLLRSGGRPRPPKAAEGKPVPLAPRTVGHVHRVLHRALGHAALWGVVGHNVAAVVSPPSVPEAEITILSQDQIDATLRHLEGRTLRPIVTFLLGTGARRGEALALRWKDLDLEKGKVLIERSLEQTKAGLRVKSPKTRKGRRNISISASLVAELRAHRARQQELRFKLGMGRVPDDGLVFALSDGSARSPHWLTQKFALAMAELGIECSLHSLRHCHVSQLIAAGMDVLTISRRIGHASPEITLRVYGHWFGNTDAKAAEIMEAAFAKLRTE
jgi:integrase